MGNFIIEDTHISQIRVGDTVEHNGEIKTISGTNIKRCSFMGTSIFGDSYRIGRIPVKKVIFICK